MNSFTSLVFSSYNCRGFNATKSHYISSLLSKCTILLLQEHWLSDEQQSSLACISSNIAYAGISGFGRQDVLAGRPYGGCAILWQANPNAWVSPLIVYRSRVCAVRVSFDSVNLLKINIYMPYEDGDNHIDEFVSELTIIEEVICGHRDCHVVLAGDFNVHFCIDWSHTAITYSIVSVRIVVLFPLIAMLPLTSTIPINLT